MKKVRFVKKDPTKKVIGKVRLVRKTEPAKKPRGRYQRNKLV